MRRRHKNHCHHYNHQHQHQHREYFARSDIRSNLDGSNTQSGIPLTLSI
jgi:hypothetical protein